MNPSNNGHHPAPPALPPTIPFTPPPRAEEREPEFTIEVRHVANWLIVPLAVIACCLAAAGGYFIAAHMVRESRDLDALALRYNRLADNQAVMQRVLEREGLLESASKSDK